MYTILFLFLYYCSTSHQLIAVTIISHFDHSSVHCAYSDDALLAHKMNVSDGAKQPFMSDTILWDEKPQKMVTSSGIQKGMKALLEEHEINITGLREWDMVKIIEDFKFQRMKLKELILIKIMFIPKFHCELNPIERVWCHAKSYSYTYSM